MHRSGFLFMTILLLIVVNPGLTRAEWEPDGYQVVPVYGGQSDAVIIPDGTGNVIIVWVDNAELGDHNIFAQKLDIYGNAQWGLEGIPVCTASDHQEYPDAASDGAGGVIVTWQDYRSGTSDIYAQRIDADGTARWTADGVAICTLFEYQTKPRIIADGYGGAVIVWQDNWSTVHWDIYAQRVDEDGAVVWTPGGISICSLAEDQTSPSIVADGTGGAIIAWRDIRSGVSADIFAQRILIDGTGTARWTTDGVAVCEDTESQKNPDLVPDLEGGAIIVWEDYRNSDWDIFAQRIDSLGAVQWATDGVAVTSTHIVDDQIDVVIGPDGSGGVIAAWSDRRDYSVTSLDIYAQRVDTDGHWRWVYGGVPVCTEDDSQWPVAIAADGEGGAFIAWRDIRYGSFDIYAQYMRDDGEFRWSTGGVDVCSHEASQDYPIIAADGLGGAIVAWADKRSGQDKLYAQRIEPRYGHWGVPEPVIAHVTDIAPDEGGSVDLSWYGSQLDDYRYGEVTHYSLWRATNTIPLLASPDELPLLTSPEEIGKDFDGSAVRIEQTSAGDYFWEWIANQDALGLAGYSYAASTRTDSTGSDTAIHYFQVVTHTQTPTTYWISAVDSGYSVDNLSPCPPEAVMAEQIFTPEGLEITWEANTEPDLDSYVIHRGLTSGFTPDGGNLIYSECDLVYFDSDWRWDSGYWYKVAAVDVHGNVSEYVLLGPDEVTGEETPETPAASYLSQNFPNPFNPVTRIRFGLKEPTRVSLRIYDTAGRLVRVLVDEPRDAGHYIEEWNGRDKSGRKVASGVYYYRVEAGDFRETKKMVLLR